MKKSGKKERKKAGEKGKKIKEKIPEKKAEIKSEIKEEKSLENEIFDEEEEINEIGFRQFLQPSVPRKTFPVLDRIAVAENADLEQQLASARISRDEKEENQISYGGKRADYGAATENNRKDMVKYEMEMPNYNDIGRNKKEDDKNKFTGHGIKNEWKEKNKEEKWYT